METYDILEPDNFYHIYNRGNNKEDIFLQEENYSYFLTLLKRHIEPVADIYSYCLLKNHFHLVVKIKSDIEIQKFGIKREKLSQPFSNFFNAYTKAINKKHNREGSLFQVRFKRKRILDENYLRNVIAYVHLNPIKHFFSKNLEYPHSSYSKLLNENPTDNQVLELFGGPENFKSFHNEILRKGDFENFE